MSLLLLLLKNILFISINTTFIFLYQLVSTGMGGDGIRLKEKKNSLAKENAGIWVEFI